MLEDSKSLSTPLSVSLLGMLNIDVRRLEQIKAYVYHRLLGMLNIDVRRPDNFILINKALFARYVEYRC